MSGGNSAPDAPDYGPLISLVTSQVNKSTALSDKQQAWAEKVYNDNKHTSDIVVDKVLGMMDTQEGWAKQDRARYESIYQPLEEQAALDAQDYSSPQRQEVNAGKAEADVASQFEGARRTAQDHLEQFGVDPSQTRAGALDYGSRIAEAAAQASAGNQARTETENIGRALRESAINTGKGLPGQSMGELAGAGGAGNQAVNTNLATTASGAQTMGTGTTWNSQANQGLGIWGNLLNTQHSNEMDAWKADQQSSSGVGSMLGMLGGVASAFLAEGGVIPEEGAPGGRPVPVEASPSGGAIPDDVPAQIEGGQTARLNAGEFVVPEDVVGWLGEKGLQQIILKARKEMTGGNGERPAQPQSGPPQPSMNGAGAIPEPMAA